MVVGDPSVVRISSAEDDGIFIVPYFVRIAGSAVADGNTTVGEGSGPFLLRNGFGIDHGQKDNVQTVPVGVDNNLFCADVAVDVKLNGFADLEK